MAEETGAEPSTSSRTQQGLRLLPWWVAALGVTAALGASAGVTLWLLYIASRATPLQQPALRLDAIRTGLTVAAGGGGAMALLLSVRRQWLSEYTQIDREKTAEAAAARERAKESREDTKLFNERFGAAAAQLGSDQPAVKLAGIYSMAGLADDWHAGRQTCIDVLCANLRRGYAPEPDNKAPTEVRTAWKDNQEFRHTIIRVITAHLRDNAKDSWQRHDFDFTGAAFDGGNFSGAVFSPGRVDFGGAVFSGGRVDFGRAVFSGGTVTFRDARFSGGTVTFRDAKFCGGAVSFDRAVFTGGAVSFDRAVFTGGALLTSRAVSFTGAVFSGGEVSFYGAVFSGGMVDFSDAVFSGGTVTFRDAKFSGGAVSFVRAVFSGGEVTFYEAEFSGGEVSIYGAVFSGGAVDFGVAVFSGGTVTFGGAVFSGGEVSFYEAEFSGGEVSFYGAVFSGGIVRFDTASDLQVPPNFDFPWSSPPPGVDLPRN